MPTSVYTSTHMSRLAILRSLPKGKRWQYFQEQLLLRIIAMIALISAAIFLVVHVVTPVKEPQVYVAVESGLLDVDESNELQTASAASLNIPSGNDNGLLIDTNFNFTSTTAGLQKLQVLIAATDLDVIVASESTMTSLAESGYVMPLSEITNQLADEIAKLTSSVSESQITAVREQIEQNVVFARGFSAALNNSGANGVGKGSYQAYAIRCDACTQTISTTSLTPANSNDATRNTTTSLTHTSRWKRTIQTINTYDSNVARGTRTISTYDSTVAGDTTITLGLATSREHEDLAIKLLALWYVDGMHLSS